MGFISEHIGFFWEVFQIIYNYKNMDLAEREIHLYTYIYNEVYAQPGFEVYRSDSTSNRKVIICIPWEDHGAVLVSFFLSVVLTIAVSLPIELERLRMFPSLLCVVEK